MGQSIVIHGLIKKRAEIAGQHKVAQKAADAIKDDLAAIDRALALCGYQDNPKDIAPRGKYKQLFGRNELKLTIIQMLRDAPADDEAITAQIDQRGRNIGTSIATNNLQRRTYPIGCAVNQGLLGLFQRHRLRPKRTRRHHRCRRGGGFQPGSAGPGHRRLRYPAQSGRKPFHMHSTPW